MSTPPDISDSTYWHLLLGNQNIDIYCSFLVFTEKQLIFGSKVVKI